jgi:hypothetical protein
MEKDHPNKDLKVHRAVLAFPDALPDPGLRDATRSHFGFRPVLIVGVSRRFYQRFGEADCDHPARLVLRGINNQGGVLVVLLQFGGHQLRCVMSLRRPLVQQMLGTMKRRGRFPMVVFEVDGHRYAGLDCDVPKEDVEFIVAAGLPDIAGAKDCRAELSCVALSCLFVDEVRSIVPEASLRAVDVALVEDGAHVMATPTN